MAQGMPEESVSPTSSLGASVSAKPTGKLASADPSLIKPVYWHP
jgi:hypothetical protein